VNALRKDLSKRLRKLAVEERAWPGRDDGFASLLFEGKELAHFHNWSEIDIRLGKAAIRRVKTGGENGQGIVVETGLAGGEQVIVEGLQGVRPGVPVVANPLPPSLNRS